MECYSFCQLSASQCTPPVCNQRGVCLSRIFTSESHFHLFFLFSFAICKETFYTDTHGHGLLPARGRRVSQSGARRPGARTKRPSPQSNAGGARKQQRHSTPHIGGRFRPSRRMAQPSSTAGKRTAARAAASLSRTTHSSARRCSRRLPTRAPPAAALPPAAAPRAAVPRGCPPSVCVGPVTWRKVHSQWTRHWARPSGIRSDPLDKTCYAVCQKNTPFRSLLNRFVLMVGASS